MIPKIKIALLQEIYRQGDNEKYGVTFAEWVETESENDPDFFRWLFDNPDLGDSECPDEAEFNEFMKNL